MLRRTWQLTTYAGNFDAFEKQRAEVMLDWERRYKKQQEAKAKQPKVQGPTSHGRIRSLWKFHGCRYPDYSCAGFPSSVWQAQRLSYI